MNRREFLIKTLTAILTARLGNPYFLLANSPIPERFLFIFTRGGHDGLQVFHLRNTSPNAALDDFLRRGRPSLMLPLSNALYTTSHILPMDPQGQFGMHPWWERLRSSNEEGTIPNNRIRCDSVTVNGGQVPLDRFLAFRLMKGAGLLNDVFNNPTTPVTQWQPNKSHFDQQARALLGLQQISGGTGYLAKIAYHNSSHQNDLFKLVGFGGFSQRELGGTPNRQILAFSSSFSQLNRGSGPMGLTLHSKSCASYQQANFQGSWFDYSSGENWNVFKNLLADLQRTDSDLHRLFKNAFEKVADTEDLSRVIANTLPDPRVDPTLYDKFRPYFYNSSGEPTIGSADGITNLMYEIAKFFLYEPDTSQTTAPSLPEKRVAALSIGGFDTHSNQQTDLATLIRSLAGALHGLFYTILVRKPELLGRVKVIILSEFGRTVFQNSALSTDHGAGNLLLAIFGLPVNSPNLNRRYDKEVGPTFTEANGFESQTISNYVQDLSSVSLRVNQYHIIPKVSMLSGLFTMMNATFPEAQMTNNPSAFMERVFYQKNYLRCAENSACLWEEFLEGLP
jgi:uncharacterized protein (DUF1501 family)